MPLPSLSPRVAAVRLLIRNPGLLRTTTLQNRHALDSIRAQTSRAFSSSAAPGSPMNLRNLALIGTTIVLGGAWYYRNELSAVTGLGPGAGQSASVTSESVPASAAKMTAEGKRIVAVDNESLYTGTLPPSTPISKETTGDGRKVYVRLTPEQATQELRKNEESYMVNRGRGVFRYDVVQIPSNNPIEDDHAEKIIEVPATLGAGDQAIDRDWMFWGVFDGHSGWTTSAMLRQTLIGFVARELTTIFKAATTDPASQAPTAEMIDEAIKKGFTRLDNEIVHESVNKVFKNPSKVAAAEILGPALSGSCALLAFYESQSEMLRVAVTGDSRAVLGRKGKNGKWTATQLSEDQTGSNEAEAARVRSEHPNEEGAIRVGRVLGGLEPTRAFGDALYKWTQETQLKIKNQFFSRTNTLVKTPPYVTAEPVITTTKVEPENGDFLVMATDGLWEMLTNEEVVGLVGKWMEEQKGGKGKGWLGGLGGKKGVLPVEGGEQNDASGQRAPVRVRQWGVETNNDRFTCEDKNAATHIARNALGGKNQDMLCGLLTLRSPFSRRYRDDLTVEVIFFGEGDKSGNVTVNEEATARKEKEPEVKAKL